MSRPAINTEVDASAIPEALKAQPRWGLWKAVWVINKAGVGKWEKKPFLSTNKPEEWRDLASVLADREGRELTGLGFCMTGVENLVAFDLDHCLNANGIPEPWAADIVERVNSYTEVTVGGDGLRIFAIGRYAEDWVNKDTVSLEIYSGNAGRYMTVSGDVWPGHEELRVVEPEVLDSIAEMYRISAASTRGAVAEMPELLEAVEVPEGLNAEAEVFLATGEHGEDRSAALNWTARCLFEVGLGPAEVLTVLYENPFAMEVALDHQRQDEGRALAYLWKHHVSPHAATARPRAAVADFAEDIETDADKAALYAEVRRLASLDPLVFSGQVKTEAKELGVGVAELRRAVDRERKKRAKAAKKGTVDYITPLPHLDEDGTPRNHLDNLLEILRRLGLTVRYNIITHEEEILIPGAAYTTDNAANASFAWVESACSLFNFPTSKLQGFLTHIADSNVYNPVKVWVESKPWDKVSRLKALYATIDTEPEYRELKEILIRRWLISAIAGAFSHSGHQYHGMLVLQGEQSLGKTRWMLRLVPEELGIAKAGMVLQPGNKDSVAACTRYWLVELGELDATFKKSDISAIKSFVTNQTDAYRVPFARRTSTFNRRTAFFASVNPTNFLHDETGNRRFWTIPCTAVDYEHDIDMQQVWAEVLELWQAGEQSWLSREEEAMLAGGNELFQAPDAIAELIESELDWEMPEAHWRWMTSSGVLRELGIVNPNNAQTQKAAMCIERLSRCKQRRRRKYGVERRVPYRRGVTLNFDDLA